VKNNFVRLLEDLARENSRYCPVPEKQQEYDKLLSGLQLHYMNELSGLRRGKLLDLGCAYGTQTVAFKKLGYIETEAADNMPELSGRSWWAKQGIKFHKYNVETDGVLDRYDTIVMSEVLEHLNYNPVKAMENVYNMLNDGGILLLSTPMKELETHRKACTGRWCEYLHYRDIPGPYNGYKFEDAHHHLYSRVELVQLLEEVGFHVHEIFPVWRGKHWYVLAIKSEKL
jgi:2-polyprenyl-3-methyl-5-hydroxy-6-metoxy-1,4-benzoquinol methylase